MNATAIRVTSAAAFALLFASGAQAEYRCSAQNDVFEAKACQAAQQGPGALRHYIDRMRSIGESLYFPDYVNEATLNSWKQASDDDRGDTPTTVAVDEGR